MPEDLSTYLLNSPPLREFVASFPLPIIIAMDDEIRLRGDVLSRRGATEADSAPATTLPREEIARLYDKIVTKEIPASRQTLPEVPPEYGWTFNIAGKAASVFLWTSGGVPKEKNEDILTRLLRQICHIIFGSNDQDFAKFMEFANSQTLYANIVIEGGDERARDLVSALLLARAGVNSPAVINANEAASWNKSAPEKLASLIKIETNVLIVRDPEKLSAVAQESLYKFLLKRKLDAAGTDNQLNIITLSGSPLSSLAARGEFSRGLLNILQTEKIALPASSREEHARGDKLDTIDAKDSDPVLNDEESTCFIPGEEERHITEEADEPAGELNLGERIERLQKKCILTALQMANGRKDKAARLLNMNLRTFQRRCAKYGI